MPKQEIQVMTIRIPPSLHQWLMTAAGKEYVSMNAKIIQLLKKEEQNAKNS